MPKLLRILSSLDKSSFFSHKACLTDKYLTKTIILAAAIFILMVGFTQNSYAGPPIPPTVDGLYDQVGSGGLLVSPDAANYICFTPAPPSALGDLCWALDGDTLHLVIAVSTDAGG